MCEHLLVRDGFFFVFSQEMNINILADYAIMHLKTSIFTPDSLHCAVVFMFRYARCGKVFVNTNTLDDACDFVCLWKNGV